MGRKPTNNLERRTMKKQIAVNFGRALSFFAHPLKEQMGEENNHDRGSRNPLPVTPLPSRPVSVPSGWDIAGNNEFRLPSTLNDWLASKSALVIR
jgi:hypothetical protein